MCRRLFSAITIIIAVIMALALSVAKPDSVDYIVIISRFFDTMLPILAVGALIKYLLCFQKIRNCQCSCDSCKQCGCKR